MQEEIEPFISDDDGCDSRSRAVISTLIDDKKTCDFNEIMVNARSREQDTENIFLKDIPYPNELYFRAKPFKNMVINEWIITNRKNIPKMIKDQVKYGWIDRKEEDTFKHLFKTLSTTGNVKGLYIDDKRERYCYGLNFVCNLVDKIKFIDLDSSLIHHIPPCINNYKRLNGLLLNGNYIKKIVGLNGMINLEHLSLENNEIKRIKNIDTLIRLKKLSLDGNKIKKIEGIDNLTQLEELTIAHNQISKNECKKFEKDNPELYVLC